MFDLPRSLCSAAAVCLAASMSPALACDTALILTIDVSNSVDVAEYAVQTDGLADALNDPAIIEAMVQGQVALSVIQWSGVERQEVSLPWTRMNSASDVALFSALARDMPRAFVLSDTALGDAIMFSLDHFAQVPDCTRKVIDISGDGPPNAGLDIGAVRTTAERQGVTINAIAIEAMGLALTNFFKRSVVTRDGFVITAQTHREYPASIRAKILREVSRVLG